MISRTARTPRGHHVADFDMLHDLIEHAGATHMAVDKDNIANRLYVPKGKGYLELRVWMKEGFWHAQAPDRGKLINQLPRDASPIINRPSKTKSLWKRVVGAPRGRVEDYEAIDRRDRVIAGPFKHYSDAKDAAGPAGAVRFVPSRGKPSKTTEASRGARRAPRAGAEEAGKQYAYGQVQSDHFNDWVREQMLAASKSPPEDVLPLETKADAMKVARNMLQQLEWDTRRELSGQEIESMIGAEGNYREFWEGFREALVSSREWLADELLTIKSEMSGGVVEASRRKSSQSKYKPGKLYKHLKVDRVVPSHGAYRVEFNDGFSVQVHGGSGRDDLLYAMHPYDTRLEQRAPGPESRRDYQYAALKAVLGDKPADFVVDHDGDVRAVLTGIMRAEEKRRRPKAKRSVRRRR